MEQLINSFFNEVLKQDKSKLRSFFTRDAEILWHNTNELFNLEEYLIANCEYPGTWEGKIERIDKLDTCYSFVALVYEKDKQNIFRSVSYITFKDGLIHKLEEYFADVQVAPKWRIDKQIGKSIN